MLSSEGDLVGDEVPHIHVHLYNDAINEFGSIQGDIKSMGGRNPVRVGKNTPCMT